MDQYYNEIIDKLNEKKDSHPNLTKLWTNYMTLTKERFINNIKKCQDLLEMLDDENMRDLSLQSVVTLFILQEQLVN
jgi:uncharacterized protein YjiS (DUF1127 family)